MGYSRETDSAAGKGFLIFAAGVIAFMAGVVWIGWALVGAMRN